MLIDIFTVGVCVHVYVNAGPFIEACIHEKPVSDLYLLPAVSLLASSWTPPN